MYKIKVSDLNPTTTVHLKTELLDTTTLLEGDYAYVIAYQYWDSHGTKVRDSDYPDKTWKRVHVEIIQETVRYGSGDDCIIKHWHLRVNGERIEGGSVDCYKERGCNLYIDFPFGAG